MTLGRIGFALALVAVLCVLTVFFFHAIQGPYSVVHGPVTALRSSRAAAGLRTAIVHAGQNSLRDSIEFIFSPFSSVATPLVEPDTGDTSPSRIPILRC
jgi:hypothetical protein